MERERSDLEETVIRLSKKNHTDPAIIVVMPKGTESIGPVDKRWEIGSITKVFTALLLAQLHRTGQVSMTETVAPYLPQKLKLPKNFEKITFANLATHQSGLPRLPSLMKLFGKDAMVDPYAVFDEDRVLRAIQETKLKSIPGTRRPRYSNYGFGLLGFALEKVTGKTFEELLMHEIIAPIGLNSATFCDEGLRRGHSGKKAVGPWHMGRFRSMGGLRMSASDLSKFLSASQDLNHSLAPAFADTFKIRYTDKKVTIGLAWHYLKEQKIVGHGGGTLGAMTEAFINLENGSHVVLFGDGNQGTAREALALLK